jgi:PmbA protein
VEISNLAEKIIKFGEKYGEVALEISSTKKENLSYNNRKVSSFEDGEEVSLGVRISRGKKFGYSFTTDLKNWRDAVISAAKLMKISRELDLEVPLVSKKKLKDVKGLYYKEVSHLTPAEIFEFGKELIGEVKDGFNVPAAEISREIEERVFANSNGVFLKHKETSFSSSIEVSNGSMNAYDFHTSHNTFDVRTIGKTASNLLEEKIKAEKINSFRGDVLFDYFAISDLFETVIVPAVLASNVQTKRSIFYGRKGEKIFSENINIKDNGILSGGLYSSSFDYEGEARRNTTLFEKGVLKNFLYDTYTAIKDNTKSTGNSGGIDVIPNVSASNFIIGKGKYSKDKLISQIDKGIFVREIVGTHLINPTTGDCSVGAEDVFYIEKGSIVHPVKHAMLGFNLFDALKKVELIGKTQRQESNIVAPQMVFENIQVVA